jgi:transcriptional regulator with XRE-family HTH domain
MTYEENRHKERTAGLELRLLRTEKGKSLREVSNAVGISENYLSEIERNKKLPADDIIRELASYFNIDEKYLFDKFDKIPLKLQEELKGHDALSRTLYDISKDESLSEADKEVLYDSIQKLYLRHKKK